MFEILPRETNLLPCTRVVRIAPRVEIFRVATKKEVKKEKPFEAAAVQRNGRLQTGLSSL